MMDLIDKDRSEKLTQYIIENMTLRGGRISFAEFMNIALYTPELGYYMSNKPKIGNDGDFTTSPEISPLFGECIAKQCEQVLREISGGGDILEFGPGNGTLAKTVLMMLYEQGNLPEKYYLFDVSPYLRAKQQETLSKLPIEVTKRLVWLDSFPLTTKFKGVMIANEVIDAMPVHRFICQGSEIREAYVKAGNEKFDWCYSEIDSKPLMQLAAQLRDQFFPEPYCYETEINLLLKPWIESISRNFTQGLLLLIDYGYVRYDYYDPSRASGTLMAYYQQEAIYDPLIHPGLMDITAFVDFTSVAEVAALSGMTVAGYTTQAAFLLSCGLLDLQSRHFTNEDERLAVESDIGELVLSTKMGEAFQVMALTKELGESPSLLGFGLKNRLDTLRKHPVEIFRDALTFPQ